MDNTLLNKIESKPLLKKNKIDFSENQDPDTLFSEAVKTFDVWYKFFNEEYYHFESYKIFKQAKKIYQQEGKLKKVSECYEYILKCLDHNIKFISLLGKYYEKYADFLIKSNRITSGIKYYDLAEKIYSHHKINLEHIIRIKTVKRCIYIDFMDKQLNEIFRYQYDNNELINSCKEIIKIISPSDINSKIDLDITNKCLQSINNVKTQQQKTQYIYEAMRTCITLGNELTELRLLDSHSKHLTDIDLMFSKKDHIEKYLE